VGISFDETTTPRDIELLMSIFRGTNVRDFDDDNVGEPPIRIPQSAIRTSEYSRIRSSTHTTPKPRCCAI
jgi:hypothetical protein